MRYNVGTHDRVIRVIIGVAILSLVWLGPQTAWGYLGFIPLLTGIFGFCPIYALMKISTNRGTAPNPAR